MVIFKSDSNRSFSMKYDSNTQTVDINEILVLNDRPGGAWWGNKNKYPSAGGIVPATKGPTGKAATTHPAPPCQPPCLKVPKQCHYPISQCKIIWSTGNLKGCTFSWSTFANFKDAKLYPTTPGGNSYIGPDGPSWNPPLIGPPPAGWGPLYANKPNPGWNPPLAKNLPEVIAKKIACDCEVIPDYDPVYAKANLYPGVGIGYQRSKVIIVYTDEMYQNQPDLEPYPKRDIDYHLHVNRLTERIRINRRTK